MLYLPDWFLLFVPYRRSTLTISLSVTSLQNILNQFSDTRLLVKDSPRQSLYYMFQSRGEQLYIKGPLGHFRGRGRWCLVARGKFQITAQGTLLQLKIRFAASHLASAFLGLGFYLAAAYWIFSPNIATMLLPIFFQLIFLYSILLGIFQFEMSQLLKQLKLLFKAC